MKKQNLSKLGLVVSALVLTFAIMGCSSTTAELPSSEAQVSSEAPTELPSDMPTEMPTDMPTEMPTDMPTEAALDVEGEEVAAKIVSIDGETVTLETLSNGMNGGRGGMQGDKELSGEAPDGKMQGGEKPADQAPSGEAPNGEAPNGEAPNGEAPNGEAPSGEAPSGEAPNGEAPAGDGKMGKGGMKDGGQGGPDGKVNAGETLTLTLTDSTEYKDCTVDDLEAGTIVKVSYNEDNEIVSISIGNEDKTADEAASDEATEESVEE